MYIEFRQNLNTKLEFSVLKSLIHLVSLLCNASTNVPRHLKVCTFLCLKCRHLLAPFQTLSPIKICYARHDTSKGFRLKTALLGNNSWVKYSTQQHLSFAAHCFMDWQKGHKEDWHSTWFAASRWLSLPRRELHGAFIWLFVGWKILLSKCFFKYIALDHHKIKY